MIDHYEMPHARADECPHAGVGKACHPCRERFERAPITPDMIAAADAAELTYMDAHAGRLGDSGERLTVILRAALGVSARTPPCAAHLITAPKEGER